MLGAVDLTEYSKTVTAAQVCSGGAPSPQLLRPMPEPAASEGTAGAAAASDKGGAAAPDDVAAAATHAAFRTLAATLRHNWPLSSRDTSKLLLRFCADMVGNITHDAIQVTDTTTTSPLIRPDALHAGLPLVQHINHMQLHVCMQRPHIVLVTPGCHACKDIAHAV